eukprot:GEMP01011706.1.p1 GENE.GEMP01011706.1~~GEMP01011706.1.p1  ORF type:complete len:526 (+),score=94.08 GEMP01011706.1:77-1654(+)
MADTTPGESSPTNVLRLPLTANKEGSPKSNANSVTPTSSHRSRRQHKHSSTAEGTDDSPKHKTHKRHHHSGGDASPKKHRHGGDKSPKVKSPRAPDDKSPSSHLVKRHQKHHDADGTPRRRKGHASSDPLGRKNADESSPGGTKKKIAKKPRPVPSENPRPKDDAADKLAAIPVFDSADFGSPGIGTTRVSPQKDTKMDSPVRRALLISCTYKSPEAVQIKRDLGLGQLHGLLTNEQEGFGFESSNIKILVDTDFAGAAPVPSTGYSSRDGIIAAMKDLVQDAKSGDSFFFAFSGIGTPAKGEDTKPSILPSDHAENGPISEELIHDLLVKPLPEGVRMTALIDTPFVGFALDLRYEYRGGDWKDVTKSYNIAADVRLFSTRSPPDESNRGRLMNAFSEVVSKHFSGTDTITWTELFYKMEEIVQLPGVSAPQIIATSSQFYDCNNAVNLTFAEPNQATLLGPVSGSRLSPPLKVTPDSKQNPNQDQATGSKKKICIFFSVSIGIIAAGVAVTLVLLNSQNKEAA